MSKSVKARVDSAPKRQSSPSSLIPQEIFASILGYKEDGEWVALALELDLRGYGETFEEALSEVDELCLCQIGFADFKDQPELIFRPAEPVYWQLYEQARQTRIRDLLKPSVVPEYPIRGLPVPAPHVIDALKSKFYPSNA